MVPFIVKVDPLLCAGCGQCLKAYPYEASQVVDGNAVVNINQCKACGTFAGACP